MSKNSYSKVGGENVRLLQALIDEAPSYTKPTNSRNANILKSIINNTEYNEPPQSEIEELLIALKAKIGGEIEVNELTVTENGSYDAGLNKAYNPVNVELPLDSKEITANGTYNASDDNLAGFSQVTVNVEGYKLKDIPNTPTAIATFTDGADLPMPKLEVGIEPVQEGSGDPSPTNIRTISGWDEVNVGVVGVNRWNPNSEPTVEGSYYGWLIDKPTSEGSISVTLFDKGNGGDISGVYFGITNNGSDSSGGVTWAINSGTIMSEGKITREASYVSIYPKTAEALAKLLNRFEVMVTLGNAYYPTTYEPYNGHTYTLDLDGTRYGGKVDLVSGVMTVDRAYVDLGTLNWFTGYGGFIVGLNDIAPWTFNTQAPTTLICSAYPTMAYSVSTDMSLSRVASTTYIRILDSRYTAPSDFKTAMNGVQLVYELATPLTIQLTPTVVKSLAGVNNISADSGDVLGGKYFAEL